MEIVTIKKNSQEYIECMDLLINLYEMHSNIVRILGVENVLDKTPLLDMILKLRSGELTIIKTPKGM